MPDANQPELRVLDEAELLTVAGGYSYYYNNGQGNYVTIGFGNYSTTPNSNGNGNTVVIGSGG